jgi:hypothetical protein
VAAGALAAPALCQTSPTFGVGATYGSVNDITHSLALDGFKPSEYTIFVDYKFEPEALLRLTYGSMWTSQSLSGSTINGVYVPSAKEHVNYLDVDVSYQYAEGFYTGGVFGGVGGYQVKPEPVPPEFAAYADLDQKVFGFNFGVDGEFRVVEHLSIVLRVTYHNLLATPHRQFLNAAAGLVARF